MAEVPVRAREIRRHRALCDVHAAAPDERVRPCLCLELLPQPQGFTRKPRIGGIEVIAAGGPRAPERRGHRIPDPTTRADAWYAVNRPMPPPRMTTRSSVMRRAARAVEVRHGKS